jgi:hypothetical protein
MRKELIFYQGDKGLVSFGDIEEAVIRFGNTKIDNIFSNPNVLESFFKLFFNLAATLFR